MNKTDFFHKRWHKSTLFSLLGISLLLAISLILVFKHCLCVEYNEMPWTALLAVSGAPWALFLWYLRDYTKKQDIETKWKDNQTKEKELWQQDFHVQQERIADWERPAVQLSALYILKGYFEKTSLPKHLQKDESLKEPILNIFRALLVEIGKRKDAPPLANNLRNTIHSVVLDKIDFESAKDIDWTNIDLSGQELSGKDLSGFWMPNADLKDAKMQDTMLIKAKVWGATFDGATLFRAKFNGADVSRCTFCKAHINDASFESASVQSANFTSVIGIDTAIMQEARYDEKTSFPKGFDPKKAGMILVRRGKTEENEPRWIPV